MKQLRLGFALSVALLAGLLVPSSGLASTTIGQAPPTDGAGAPCGVDSGHV